MHSGATVPLFELRSQASAHFVGRSIYLARLTRTKREVTSWRFSMVPPLGRLWSWRCLEQNGKAEWIFHPQSPQRLLSVAAVPRTPGVNVPWGLIGKIRDLALQCCVWRRKGEGQGGRGMEDMNRGRGTDQGLEGASLTADPQFPAGGPGLGARCIE